MNRRFTHSEAESLLPEVEISIRDAVSAKTEYDTAERALHALSQRVMVMGGTLVDRDTVLEHRVRRDRCAQRLKAGMDAIHAHGCLVKDLDIGLIDFPTLLRGREVYLCWKLGEAGIRYWHGIDEGFAGRKPIDQDFLDHNRGDAPN